MKQFIFFLTLLGFQYLKAQSPQGINYQAIARNASGALVANAPVGVRISILDQSPTGTVLYAETHQPNTNANGSFSLVIGQGTVSSGTFATIPWGNQAKFLQVEYDPAGGTNYTVSGTQQLMSVPYALYAEKTGEIDNDTSATNEIQNLSLINDSLKISGGNQVRLYDHPIVMTANTSLDRQIKNVGNPTDTTDVVNAQTLQAGNLIYGQTSGTANNFILNLSPPVLALQAGMKVIFKSNMTITGASTLNINGLGAKTIVKNATAPLQNGDIITGQIIEAVYDGTNFQVIAGLNNLVSSVGGPGWGADLLMPDGICGCDTIKGSFSSYTVPAGKNLYIRRSIAINGNPPLNSKPHLQLNGFRSNEAGSSAVSSTSYHYVPIPEGVTLTAMIDYSNCNIYFEGLLCKAKVKVIYMQFLSLPSLWSVVYTVPPGFTFVRITPQLSGFSAGGISVGIAPVTHNIAFKPQTIFSDNFGNQLNNNFEIYQSGSKILNGSCRGITSPPFYSPNSAPYYRELMGYLVPNQ